MLLLSLYCVVSLYLYDFVFVVLLPNYCYYKPHNHTKQHVLIIVQKLLIVTICSFCDSPPLLFPSPIRYFLLLVREYISKIDGRQDLMDKLANLDQNEKVCSLINTNMCPLLAHLSNLMQSCLPMPCVLLFYRIGYFMELFALVIFFIELITLWSCFLRGFLCSVDLSVWTVSGYPLVCFAFARFGHVTLEFMQL